MLPKPIICFEGPSSIGKTTLCDALSRDFNIIPEVNELFSRPPTASKYWYLEKQVERYQKYLAAPQISILDGDIFQPIWYNWVYGYPEQFLPKVQTHTFYREQLQKNRIAFPDHYFIFYTSEFELRKRKNNDPNRQRRNFDKHLKFIQPQQQYFRFLQDCSPIQVSFVEYSGIAATKEKILQRLKTLNKRPRNDVNIFNNIITWLNIHPAKQNL